MKRLALVAALATLSILPPVPVTAQDVGKSPYLTVFYEWTLPMLPNCSTDTAFSCHAPFTIRGDRILGLVKKDRESAGMDLVPLVPNADEPVQEIDYSYRCGACEVKGHITIHEIAGRVEKSGGKEMLHFFVSHSEPYCQVDCPTDRMDFDCSFTELVVDEFIAPRQDGYIVMRPPNAKFKYSVHLR